MSILQYYNADVKYIGGHNSDLVIDGCERINLTKFKTHASLHALLQRICRKDKRTQFQEIC